MSRREPRLAASKRTDARTVVSCIASSHRPWSHRPRTGAETARRRRRAVAAELASRKSAMTSARLASVGRVLAGRRGARRARGGERRAMVRASARDDGDDARCGRRRDALRVGDVVEIALVKRPGDGDGTRTARGEISDFVTNSSFHADGIKVRLRSGEIGRGRATTGSEGARPHPCRRAAHLQTPRKQCHRHRIHHRHLSILPPRTCRTTVVSSRRSAPRTPRRLL